MAFVVRGVPDNPGVAGRIFRAVADAEIDIDMVLQNVSSIDSGRTDVTFTVAKSNGGQAVAELENIAGEVGFHVVVYDDHVGKVSLVGAGMRSHGEHRDHQHLGDPDLGADPGHPARRRGQRLHSAFELGGDEPAVVHAGSGR